MDGEASELLRAAIEEVSSQTENGNSLHRDLSREDIAILYTLGYNLYQIGDYAQAKTIFQQLILARPMEQKYWIGLGSVLQMQKNYSRALTAWGMAALLLDTDPVPHFHAAECLLSLGEVDEAFKAFQAAKQRMNEGTENPSLMHKIEAFQEAWQKITKKEEIS
ncbi:MAG: SycD/LcrH family type III secretion system chaperone VcrH [Simkaniaceae bacterium]